ncbi:ABC transporter substrate-binding protein [Candidatus Nephthysia bennettiae]|uniref:ABC transporter substrate-binding protein n=1 Tax=Candidatus Nephthysia bennettiae TaxID=3127016 RepID=A0A934N9S1_9BACT|nr:ABC transporter substrate-binding protein [Candidatus Dormibacteraeota bacterium]MBJ7613706.1 ABC transporter substrate-binding protein [Candidatus Dormibacteraeota bacterium]
MSRRMQTALAALVLVLATACSLSTSQPRQSASGAPEKASLKMGVGGQTQIVYLPLTLADGLGYFKDEGISVEVDDLRAGPDALKAMLGGSVDMVTGAYEDTIRAQLQGTSIEMFTTLDVSPGLVLMVGKQHQDQVKSIKDLAGHPVGVTSEGSSTDEMVRYLLKQNSMAADAVPVVAIGSGYTAIDAITSGQVWAGAMVEPAASQAERSATGRALYDTRTAQGTHQVFGGSWPAAGFYASSEFAKQNPRSVRAIARAGVRSLKYIKSHSASDIANHLPSSFFANGDKPAFVDMLQKNLGTFSDTGLMPPDGPNDVLETLKAADTKTDWSTVALNKTYDNGFVQKAG